MNNVSELFSKLKSYIIIISWVFTILDSVVTLFFGGFLGALLGGQDYWLIVWPLGAIYLALLIARIATQRLFPSSVIEELHSKQKLQQTEQELARRDVISTFITDSITALNEQTCALTSELEEALYSQAVETGLASVIEPLISRPHYLFDCNEFKFTVACLVTYDLSDGNGEQEFIVFRDDHEIGQILQPSLIEDHTVKGDVIDIQKAIQRCYNDNIFVCESFTFNDRALSIAASPIPLICETTVTNGVLLFITHCGHPCPSDVSGTLSIFGRIIANWLAKYSDCIISREITDSKTDD